MFAVIFDMDGTLLDTQRICIPAWEYAGKQQGIAGMGKHVVNVCGMNNEGSSAYLKENFPQLDIKRFKDISREYIIQNSTIEFKAGAEELLKFLKENNIKVGLASGTSRPSVNHHLKEVGLEDYFDATVVGTEVANGKPHPDVFLRTAELLGVKPQDCFVFEDSYNGIKAAHTAGMRCFGIEDVVPFDEETKELLFMQLECLSDAVDVLKGYL